MSKEYGLCYNADMVKAMMDGRKTMTRRIPTFMNCTVDGKRVNKEFWSRLDIKNGTLQKDLYSGEVSLTVLNLQTKLFHDVRPIYKPGDGLWVREAYATNFAGSHSYIWYKANGYPEKRIANRDCIGKWKPSIHMPRWASRIGGTITSVHFEFLQDISEEDAIKEGVIPCRHFKYHINTSTCSFKKLWDSIYGKTEFAWQENYPVISIIFKKKAE